MTMMKKGHFDTSIDTDLIPNPNSVLYPLLTAPYDTLFTHYK